MPKNHFHISHLLIHQKQLFPFPANPLPASTVHKVRHTRAQGGHCIFKLEESIPEGQDGWRLPCATIKNHPVNPTKKLHMNEPYTFSSWCI